MIRKSTMLASLALMLTYMGAALADRNYANSLPAVQGYDVVSYHTDKRPIRGSGHFTAVHDGATYQFHDQENLDLFAADPEKYVPAYGGYCAFGVSAGKKFIGDPEVWRIVDGKTYLNLDAAVQDRWLEDTAAKIAAGDRQWQRIKDTDPAEL